MRKRLICLGWIVSGFLGISPLHASEEVHEDKKDTTAPASSEDDLADSAYSETSGLILQGLDKVTARVFTGKAKINQPIHFGTLTIYARKCFKAPPEEPPESVCYLEVFESKSGNPGHPVFQGWMFASNPAASALEHPVYDVWVKEAVGE